MSKVANDPKNGAQKVTNTDEQEVAVNHSTVQEGGYDEPVNQQEEQAPEKGSQQEEKAPAERSRPRQPQEGKRAHRPYHDEETE